MLKKSIYPILFIFLSFGCATTTPITSFSYEELEMQSQFFSTKIDVNVVEFNPGLPADESKFQDNGLWPELRRAESRRFAVNLANTLNKTQAFSNVSITTDSNYISDLVVTGKIDKSNGEDLHLTISVKNSANKYLIKNKSYKHRTNQYFYDNIRNKGKDPFETLHRAIAGDIIALLKKEDLNNTKLVTELRFANKLNPLGFSDALELNTRTNTYELGFIPAEDNPQLVRSQNVRIKDQIFKNEMQKHYIEFTNNMNESYRVWQEASYDASKKKREAEAAAAASAIIGVLAIAAAASSGDSYDYSTSAYVTAAVGAGLLANAGIKASEAKIHESTINEVSKSFDTQIAPKVVEMEGVEVKLEGSIKEQYSQWQNLLYTIYESESVQSKDFNIL